MERCIGERNLHVVINTSDPKNIMLPYLYMEFIHRWAIKHEERVRAEVKTGEGKVYIILTGASSALEEAIEHFTIFVATDQDVKMVVEVDMTYKIMEGDDIIEVLKELFGDDIDINKIDTSEDEDEDDEEYDEDQFEDEEEYDG